MESRDLGRSGRKVSRIGLGLAALGRPGYITLGHARDLPGDHDAAAMERHAHAVMDAAWHAGVRYVDAAPGYGRAEEFLASWLDATGNRLVVGSKWGYRYTANWRVDVAMHEEKDHSLENLERQLAESQTILGSHLALHQIHSATESSGVLDRPEVLDRLARIKHESGVAIGVTLSGPDSMRVLDQALGIEVDGVPLFDVVQATWNILEPSLTGALRVAHGQGMGVIIKEALANGRLTERNHDPAFAPTRAVLIREAERLGCALDQLALAAALALPFVDCVLSGATTVDQLASNIRALDVRLDAAARDASAMVAEPVARYWETRARLPWN
ncbi:MAG TPA: aldo/keto reductase [Thermomicrobiales bacterium]|nr:aldo/keto reductase [Thermomicrobiales bacterium]